MFHKLVGKYNYSQAACSKRIEVTQICTQWIPPSLNKDHHRYTCHQRSYMTRSGDIHKTQSRNSWYTDARTDCLWWDLINWCHNLIVKDFDRLHPHRYLMALNKSKRSSKGCSKKRKVFGSWMERSLPHLVRRRLYRWLHGELISYEGSLASCSRMRKWMNPYQIHR